MIKEPGWVVDQEDQSLVCSKAGYVIAEAFATGAGGDEETIANARLIAAAPDLYEALEEALEFQNSDTDCMADSVQSSPDEEEREHCADERCHEHDCMVARVNRWRAALKLAREGR